MTSDLIFCQYAQNCTGRGTESVEAKFLVLWDLFAESHSRVMGFWALPTGARVNHLKLITYVHNILTPFQASVTRPRSRSRSR